MRILVTTVPACGHFFPVVSLAWALRGAGHQVLVAGPRELAKEARSAGLAATVVGDKPAHAMWAGNRNPTGQGTEALAEFGVAVAEATVDDLLALWDFWCPDLVMSDPMDIPGPLLAALRDVPLVCHRWGLQFPDHLLWDVARPVRSRISALHQRFGVDAGRAPDAVVDTCPPSLRLDADAAWLSQRYIPYCGAGIAPGWLFEPRTRPRIGVSMGSVPLAAGVDGLRVTADALADLPVEVVLAGMGSRSSELGDVPANARAAGWLPHDQLLPTCDVVVHHGGAGSSMASLIHGLPQVVLPQMGDQFCNADQLVRRRAARKVDLADRSVTTVREAVEDLLEEGTYRRNAHEVQAEIAAMPRPVDVVVDVERIAGADSAAPGLVAAARA
jgi:L-noviosyl transferase